MKMFGFNVWKNVIVFDAIISFSHMLIIFNIHHPPSSLFLSHSSGYPRPSSAASTLHRLSPAARHTPSPVLLQTGFIPSASGCRWARLWSTPGLSVSVCVCVCVCVCVYLLRIGRKFKKRKKRKKETKKGKTSRQQILHTHKI